MNNEQTSGESKVKLWLKRMGVAGFFFFLIKGLVWIGIAAVAYYSAKD